VTMTRDDALALDAADPLASWRDEFIIPDGALVYLDGNSLGRTPRRTLDALRHVIEHEWAADLIGSWEHWIELPQRVGDELAPLIGAAPGEVVLQDSVTVNLYRLVHAALRRVPQRRVLAVDAADFPTDRYVVEGVASSTGHELRTNVERLDDVAVVVRSVVDYRTAEVVDVAAETARAASAGATVIWDLSHAVGVLPIDLRAAGAELAVGCTYKFLNGGPGAPAFSYVAEHVVASLDQPIWGWFGQRDQFAMGPAYEPVAGIGRLLAGTPGILGLVAARYGIDLTASAGIGRIAAKARALTAYALARCDELRLESPTPRDDRRRGGHVSVRHPDAAAIVRDAAAEGVVTDFRPPDLVRISCSPLMTRFVDVHDGLEVIASSIRLRSR
jgi:kynureninase